ncbi:MAG: tyrosine--tRNA ligase, partial [Planctomycetota bacterium]
IVSGIDLIRRDLGSEEAHAYAITAPLITRSDGKKMGKSESGAIWMTADRTSPYAFYQYWLNVVDDDAVRFLGLFTDLDRDAIEAVRVEHAARPHERNAQRALATYMTDLLHGDDERKRAETASNALFTGNVSALDDGLLQEVFAGVASSTHARTTLEGEGASLVDVLVETALAKSRREARQYLGDGAVSINGDRVEGDALMRRLSCSDLLHGRTILLRRGKKQWHALRFE